MASLRCLRPRGDDSNTLRRPEDGLPLTAPLRRAGLALRAPPASRHAGHSPHRLPGPRVPQMRRPGQGWCADGSASACRERIRIALARPVPERPAAARRRGLRRHRVRLHTRLDSAPHAQYPGLASAPAARRPCAPRNGRPQEATAACGTRSAQRQGPSGIRTGFRPVGAAGHARQVRPGQAANAQRSRQFPWKTISVARLVDRLAGTTPEAPRVERNAWQPMTSS